MTTATARLTIDVRKIAPQDRYRRIGPALARLSTDAAVDLVNDADLQALLVQRQGGAPGPFAWDCLESGPENWRVRLTGPQAGHGHGQCCGSCGGA
jgi:uncharacterized protein (DUF2249 family)